MKLAGDTVPERLLMPRNIQCSERMDIGGRRFRIAEQGAQYCLPGTRTWSREELEGVQRLPLDPRNYVLSKEGEVLLRLWDNNAFVFLRAPARVARKVLQQMKKRGDLIGFL